MFSNHGNDSRPIRDKGLSINKVPPVGNKVNFHIEMMPKLCLDGPIFTSFPPYLPMESSNDETFHEPLSLLMSVQLNKQWWLDICHSPGVARLLANERL